MDAAARAAEAHRPLPLLAEGANKEFDDFVERVRAAGQQLSNVQRVLGHSPALATATAEYGGVIRNFQPVAQSSIELAILRLSVITGCTYPFAQHVRMAQSAGVTEAQLRGVADWGSAACFDELERLVLQAVDEIDGNAGIGETTATGLASHLSAQDLVELVTVITFYRALIGIMRSFAVPPDAAVRGTWEAFWPFETAPADPPGAEDAAG
jgi:AhpD family alkylhydroperoxidase